MVYIFQLVFIKIIFARDSRAKSVIVQNVSDRHIEYINDSTSAFDMMTRLRNLFECKSTMTK